MKMEKNTPLKILICDDDPGSRKLVRSHLRSSSGDFIVTEAGRKGEIQKALEKGGIDLILLDIQMPEKSGLEWLAEIVEKQIAPVIMLTGYGSEEIAVQSIHEGAMDYVPKDHLTQDRLLSTVKVALEIWKRKRAEADRERVLKELERKNAELQKAMEHMADLEEITRIKSEFLSITSHELKTPLTPMKAQLQIILAGYVGELNDAQKKCIEIVLRNLTRLSKLIKDILDLSRIEAGRIRLVFEPMNINDIVKEAIIMQESFATNKNIEIRTKLADLPHIVGDAERIGQAIGNLLNNAIKFSKKSGKVIIETKRLDLEGHENVQFSITDYGTGISKADQEKLFKPFSQINTSMSREQAGTGLGLAIVRGIIQAHSGKVWVESELGKGSIFHFAIPTGQQVTEKEASYIR
jgi:two-component system sensor histidine kinase/response regulator